MVKGRFDIVDQVRGKLNYKTIVDVRGYRIRTAQIGDNSYLRAMCVQVNRICLSQRLPTVLANSAGRTDLQCLPMNMRTVLLKITIPVVAHDLRSPQPPVIEGSKPAEL